MKDHRIKDNELIGKEVKISHEHSDYTWMDYNSSMEKTTFDNARTVLTKAQKLLSNTL